MIDKLFLKIKIQFYEYNYKIIAWCYYLLSLLQLLFKLRKIYFRAIVQAYSDNRFYDIID